ncbi:MAG: phage protein Gp27 family protein [Terriglobia bacterium]
MERGPDKRIRSRRYKVERLPAKARALIFRGFTEGEAYEKIRSDLEAMGYRITKEAIGNYWRDIWREEHERLREAHANMALIKRALEMDPDSPSHQVANELLYTLVFQAFPMLKQEGPLRLLREAREQEGKTAKTTQGSVRSESRAEQGRAIRQRWRELYGLNPAEEEKERDEEEADQDKKA